MLIRSKRSGAISAHGLLVADVSRFWWKDMWPVNDSALNSQISFLEGILRAGLTLVEFQKCVQIILLLITEIVKGKGLDTCYSAAYMSQILATSSALQSRKWQLIGMSHWCRSALCGHPLPALACNWTHGAASTVSTISHTRPSPRSRRLARPTTHSPSRWG